METAPRQAFDAYHVWLGIPPQEQPPNHYRLLGIGLFEHQLDVIASVADRQMGHLRTFQTGKHSDLSQQLLNEVAAAKICLLNPAKKAIYDEQLRQQMIPAKDATEESTSWAVSADQPLALPEITGLKADSPAKPARRIARQWLANLGTSITIGGTCVLLVMSLLAWNTTRRGNSPIGRNVTAKAEKKQTSKQPIHRLSLEHPKADVRQPDDNFDNLPVQYKPDAQIAPTPPKEDSVVEVPPAIEIQPIVPVTMPTFEKPDASQKVAMPSFEVSDDKQPGNKPPEERPSAPQKRLPVPNDAVQEEITTQFAGIHGQNETTDKLKLANQLLQAAGASKHPDEQYVLLRNVRDLACQGGDVGLALHAIEAIAAKYDINATEEKGKALLTLAKTVDAEQIRSLFNTSRRVIAQALSEGHYEIASDLANGVNRACQRKQSKKLRKKAIDQRDWVAACCRRQEERVRAEAKLKSNPSDAESHLVLGRYYCFDADWQHALPHLAKGNDADLQQLAQRDIASPTEPNEQIELADAWWKLAQRRLGEEQDCLLLRAGYWYNRACGKLPSVIIRRKAEKRVEELKVVRQRRAAKRHDKDLPQDLWSNLFTR